MFKNEKEAIDYLVKIRKERITQQELSEKIGLTQQQISALEKGERMPKLSTFFKYINGIGKKINFEDID